MESIVCNGIGKIYGKKQVLKNINLTLEKGKIYGLIGRNGAGKTTFFRYIMAVSYTHLTLPTKLEV